MLRLTVIACLATCAFAAEHHGVVEYGGLPLPGAVVTIARDAQRFTTVTDDQGSYAFPDLADGSWTIRIEMLCFAPINQEIVAGNNPAVKWEMVLLSPDQIRTTPLAELPKPVPVPVPAPSQNAKPATVPATDALSEEASDGLLVNGTVNNGATTPFAQAAAFGNARHGSQNLFTGGIGFIGENSAFDARPFSLTGQDSPKLSYNHITALATLGGVLKIPYIMPRGINFFVAYQWTRNRDASNQTGLVPDALQRQGLFPASPPIFDPVTNASFPGNQIPASSITPQARALLQLYPLPNFPGSTRYNYQVPVVDSVHQDALQSRWNKTFNAHNQLYGSLAFQSTRADTPNLFGFLDTTDTTGINFSMNWQRTLRPHLYGNFGFQFSRLVTRSTPFFQNRSDISGDAGISGNAQDPMNWGPPTLSFASGFATLTDAQAFFNRDQTSGASYSVLWNTGGHNLAVGGDYRRQQFNYLAQQNARGTFTFTGAASGFDLTDFLLGIPDASAVAFGNADKYFRAPTYDAYVNDDWRIGPELTLNAGVRWEYSVPLTELYGRLVNLSVAPGFADVSPLVAARTGDPLIHSDRHGVQPRIGVAWRPVSGSSLVVRAGYGIEFNTSVYQTIATQMAQQAPLSKSLSVQNTPANPLTLANGFNAPPANPPQTFAVDPNFRVGYVQNWKLAIQRDLPGSLILTATYAGIKGTRGMQEFLPNTYPAGAINPCPECPRGFTYLTSNGNSTRESGDIQLRRRLHSGLTATLQYTFAKAIDDSALGGRGQGGTLIAQNWLDLRAERGLSNFDQRHLLNLQLQYTTGMGLAGRSLASGWRGTLFKDWTVVTQITAGSGLPLTPIYLVPVEGTGVVGTIRPDYTGAPLYDAPSGFFVNPAAYAAPPAGEWGDAGRNSITGPSQLSINASLGRTFRWRDRFHIDLRIDSNNALNHVTYTSWNTIFSSAQFGLPVAANAMRSIQTTLRLRF